MKTFIQFIKEIAQIDTKTGKGPSKVPINIRANIDPNSHRAKLRDHLSQKKNRSMYGMLKTIKKLVK